MEEEVTPTPSAAELMALSDDQLQAAYEAYQDVFDGMPGSHGKALRAALETLTRPTPQPADGVTSGSLESLAADSVTERTPDGYAYRYLTGLDGSSVIRHSRGEEINGTKPYESIPYYYGKPPTPTAPATDGVSFDRSLLWWLQDAIRSILRPNGGSHADKLQLLCDQLTLTHTTPAATDAVRELVGRARTYRQAVDVMNAAMQDGVNVHGAISGFGGAQDMLDETLSKFPPETKG